MPNLLPLTFDWTGVMLEEERRKRAQQMNSGSAPIVGAYPPHPQKYGFNVDIANAMNGFPGYGEGGTYTPPGQSGYGGGQEQNIGENRSRELYERIKQMNTWVTNDPIRAEQEARKVSGYMPTGGAAGPGGMGWVNSYDEAAGYVNPYGVPNYNPPRAPQGAPQGEQPTPEQLEIMAKLVKMGYPPEAAAKSLGFTGLTGGQEAQKPYFAMAVRENAPGEIPNNMTDLLQAQSRDAEQRLRAVLVDPSATKEQKDSAQHDYALVQQMLRERRRDFDSRSAKAESMWHAAMRGDTTNLRTPTPGAPQTELPWYQGLQENRRTQLEAERLELAKMGGAGKPGKPSPIEEARIKLGIENYAQIEQYMTTANIRKSNETSAAYDQFVANPTEETKQRALDSLAGDALRGLLGDHLEKVRDLTKEKVPEQPNWENVRESEVYKRKYESVLSKTKEALSLIEKELSRVKPDESGKLKDPFAASIPPILLMRMQKVLSDQKDYFEAMEKALRGGFWGHGYNPGIMKIPGIKPRGI